MSTINEQGLTPYDKGDRAEPRPWRLLSRGALSRMIDADGRDIELDRYGKVDFDDDEGVSIVTVWVERNEQGEMILHVTPLGGDIGIAVHHG